jgi:hypothetical protein
MNCKNCNTELVGQEKFCSNCGQKNIEKLDLKHIFSAFVDDFFNVDSKFVLTLKYLLLKPGRLSKKYMEGKRFSFVPPIRLYLVLSVIYFFLISIIDVKTVTVSSTDSGVVSNQENTFSLSSDGLNIVDSTSSNNKEFTFEGQRIGELVTEEEGRQMDVEGTLDHHLDSITEGEGIFGYFDKKATKANVRGNSYSDILLNQVSLFLLLFIPLLALLYAICFSRKKYGYVGHLVFNLHFNSFVIFLLCIGRLLGLFTLPELIDDAWFFFVFFAPQIYLIIAIMKFYDRKWWVAIYKYFLLLIGYISLAILFLFAVLISSMLMT